MYSVTMPKAIRGVIIAHMLLTMLLFSTSVRAEYYFSYSMPETCQSCYYPTTKKATHHRTLHTAKKVHKKTIAKMHRKFYYSHHCETYQPGNSGWVPGYWINGYWVRGSYYSYQDTKHASRSHHASRYHTHRHDDYNPDTATGDDDTWVNPGMNIDY
jgi:hypothetical protein